MAQTLDVPVIKRKGIGGHQSARMLNDEWLTPPEIVAALGSFDLDPCSPIHRPWPTAANHFSVLDNGLGQPWSGRVWLNPPYGREIGKWLGKLVNHGNGIAIMFARTETKFFFDYVWSKADAVLFMKGRPHFYTVDGIRAKANSGAPVVLSAYGLANAEILRGSGIEGQFVKLNGPQR